jgi:anti-anti-sigma factor
LDVVLQGEIDFGNVPAVLAEASSAIRRRRPAVVRVDLAGVTYFDSSAVRMLVRIASVADEVSAIIRIENASPAVRRVLEITGLWANFGMSEP